jgi:hypothetical protein
MSLYKIKSSKGTSKDVAVENLKLDGLYMQRDRAVKMGIVITSEIQKRMTILSREDKMEMYGLKDVLMAWVNDFQQQGRSDINLTPVFKRIKEMLLIWAEDGL